MLIFKPPCLVRDVKFPGLGIEEESGYDQNGEQGKSVGLRKPPP